MNGNMKEAFSRMKPLCDMIMVNPSPEHVSSFAATVCELKRDLLQELQQYMLFPFITHLQSKEITGKFELQRLLIDGMKVVLQRVTIFSFDMCIKIEMCLLGLVFEKPKPGMIADVPEELKLSVIQCLTALMLNVDHPTRVKLVQTQVPMLAQAIFVSVHLAKLEKLRVLRLAAINCLCAHTVSHPQLTDKDCHITDPVLETAVVNMMSCILPGVMAALQDVATCTDNPGHAIVVAALNAIHRVLCLTMHNKLLPQKETITADDFVSLLSDRAMTDKDVSSKALTPKDIPKRTPEWYAMAGDKLTVVVKSLVPLVTHDHYKVRKELAVLSYRIISECNLTMTQSVTMAIDVLISLSNDPYEEVSAYCSQAVDAHFTGRPDAARAEAVDSMCENFFTTLNCLPRILNNIDSSRKLSALSLVAGYLRVLCGARPQRLSGSDGYARLCDALLCAAQPHDRLQLLARRDAGDILTLPLADYPWRRLQHLDTSECEEKLQEICQKLGEAECAELLLDRLLELFQERRSNEIVYIMNYVASAPNAPPQLARRLIAVYTEEDVWSPPLELRRERAPGAADTLDVAVYDPRAWTRERVPGLYEGTTEVRYTDVSYAQPRAELTEPHACASPAQAQRNAALSCLAAEGLGLLARRLGRAYQPYLLATLCPLLERLGSPYETLHMAGLVALNDVAIALGHANLTELIARNADYFTSEITKRLKKAWNTESALQILGIVLEYSEPDLQDCLFGIIEDVLIQSCDKYYEQYQNAYLEVFEIFIRCIKKWFPVEDEELDRRKNDNEIDVLKDVLDFVKNSEEAERLLSAEESEEQAGGSVEEMYREDAQRREEDALDYDDAVESESAPLPRHLRVAEAVLRRCAQLAAAPRRPCALRALRALAAGLPLLRAAPAALLPLAHALWPALAARAPAGPAPLRAALDVLAALAALTGDFLRARAVSDVLPHVYDFLRKSSSESHLKDAGSAYRASQAFQLQAAALRALPGLAAGLRLGLAQLDEAMACAQIYLSKNQPKPLQTLAVEFFIEILKYDYGAAWQHLRRLCANDALLAPPRAPAALQPVRGSPYETPNTNYDHNVRIIFMEYK